jgi:hypothetical protein
MLHFEQKLGADAERVKVGDGFIFLEIWAVPLNPSFLVPLQGVQCAAENRHVMDNPILKRKGK